MPSLDRQRPLAAHRDEFVRWHQHLALPGLVETDKIAGAWKCGRRLQRRIGAPVEPLYWRDLVALKMSLQEIPALKAHLQKLLDRLAFGANRVNEPD